MRGGRGSVDFTADGRVFPLPFPGFPTIPYVDIPAGQTRSFVTYAGIGVAQHGMSTAYQATAA